MNCSLSEKIDRIGCTTSQHPLHSKPVHGVQILKLWFQTTTSKFVRHECISYPPKCAFLRVSNKTPSPHPTPLGAFGTRSTPPPTKRKLVQSYVPVRDPVNYHGILRNDVVLQGGRSRVEQVARGSCVNTLARSVSTR